MKPLDAALEEFVVHEEWENDVRGLENWWAVSNENGIIAYFGKEEDAFRFRLAEINRALNG